MKKIKFIIFPIFGLTSALLINYILAIDVLMSFQPINFYILSLLPGIIFGIFIALALFIVNKEKKTAEQILIWLASCAAAYHISFWIVLAKNFIIPPFCFFVAGFAGALIMLFNLRPLVNISRNNIILLALLAGIIALAWLIVDYNTSALQSANYANNIAEFIDNKSLTGYTYLYIWWNTLMAFGISIAMKNKK